MNYVLGQQDQLEVIDVDIPMVEMEISSNAVIIMFMYSKPNLRTVDFGLKDMETEECHAQYSEATIKLEDES